MPKPKGGRGKVAPYVTRQVRVPEPLVTQVDTLIEEYQGYIASGGDAANPPKFIKDNDEIKPVDKFKDKEQIVTLLTEALKLKANSGGAIKEQVRRVLRLLNAENLL